MKTLLILSFGFLIFSNSQAKALDIGINMATSCVAMDQSTNRSTSFTIFRGDDMDSVKTYSINSASPANKTDRVDATKNEKDTSEIALKAEESDGGQGTITYTVRLKFNPNKSDSPTTYSGEFDESWSDPQKAANSFKSQITTCLDPTSTR